MRAWWWAWGLAAMAACAPYPPDSASLLAGSREPPVRPTARSTTRPPPTPAAGAACGTSRCATPLCALSDPPLATPTAAALACLPGGSSAWRDDATRCDDYSCTVTRTLDGRAHTTWIAFDDGQVGAVFDQVRLPVGAGEAAFDALRRRFARAVGPGDPLSPTDAPRGALLRGREWRAQGARCDLWLERHPQGDVLDTSCALRPAVTTASR